MEEMHSWAPASMSRPSNSRWNRSASSRRRELPDSLLIKLDEKDEFPEEIIRRMCGEELGVQLLFVPEAYSGMGGNAIDVYRT